jgi:alpha-tubulin suppressor-like RCC1 family protein
VTAGGTHSCALTTAGAVRCWGANSSGQLGDSTLQERHTPVAVTSIG